MPEGREGEPAQFGSSMIREGCMATDRYQGRDPVKPPPFEYVRVSSVDEAVAQLAELGDEAKVLAGGQSLVPLLSLRLARPAHLIDINRVGELGLDRQRCRRAGRRHGPPPRRRAFRVGRPGQSAPGRRARRIGHAAIRNRGTIGGSIAHADPAAELPAVLVALDGEVEARSTRGARTIAGADFFDGFLTTALEPDELLTAVRFPPWPAGTGWSFQEFSRRSGDFAVVGVAVTLVGRRRRHDQPRPASPSAASAPRRSGRRRAEAALAGQTPSAELWTARRPGAAAGLDPPGDLHGTPAYRRHLAGVLTDGRCIEAYGRERRKA